MKKFKFSLARVKDYKNLVLEREKTALGRLQDAKNRLEKRMDDVRDKSCRLDQELKEKTAKGVKVAEIQSYRFQIDGLNKLMENLRKEHERMKRQIEEQMQKVIAAKKEVSGMEKLEEKQLALYKQEMSEAERREIAEFVETRVSAQLREEEDVPQ